MKRPIACVAAACLLAVTAGCVIADPSPYAHGVLQPKFNHAWNNAIDAMKDEGVTIAVADLGMGRIEGRRGGIRITGFVVTESLGNVKADFMASGAVAEDPGLAGRVERRYAQRMAH